MNAIQKNYFTMQRCSYISFNILEKFKAFWILYELLTKLFLSVMTIPYIDTFMHMPLLWQNEVLGRNAHSEISGKKSSILLCLGNGQNANEIISLVYIVQSLFRKYSWKTKFGKAPIGMFCLLHHMLFQQC